MTGLFRFYDFSKPINYKTELMAGLTVAMTIMPESLSFAILAGLPPLTGLYAAFIMGLITSLFGGRPGMISGGAGATVIVLIALAKSHGIEYLFATVLLAGLFQILCGVFKLGKLIRLVPQPVMYGFVNGLAVIIFVSQLEQFKSPTGTWLLGAPLLMMLGLVALTIALITLLPKLNKAIPAGLSAIAVVFALVYFFHIDTKTVNDIASLSGGFPPFHLPTVPLTFETLEIIAPYALIMAAVGLVESLLTLNLVDEMTDTQGNSNRECLAQGTGNILNGLFTGMGGCAMIAQTFVNLSAGSRARLSGIVCSLSILGVILFAAPFIEQVPMAALTGVMVVAAFNTFEWKSFRVINKMPRRDVIVGIAVALITIWLHNLALAVLIGVGVSALVFAWDSAKQMEVKSCLDDAGRRHYQIVGPLFFGSITAFNAAFDLQQDPKEVFMDFSHSRLSDMSAIEALSKLTERYKSEGKLLSIRHLSPACRELLKNAQEVITVNIID